MKTAVKKRRVVKRKKQIVKSRVKVLLEEQGKSDQWLIDILKSRFKVKESKTRGYIKGRNYISVMDNTTILICIVLKIRICHMFKNC